MALHCSACGAAWESAAAKALADRNGGCLICGGALEPDSEPERELPGDARPCFLWRSGDDEIELIACNPAAATLTDGRALELIGMPARELYAHSPDVLADLHRALDHGARFSRRVSYRMASTGRPLDIQVDYLPLSERLVMAAITVLGPPAAGPHPQPTAG